MMQNVNPMIHSDHSSNQGWQFAFSFLFRFTRPERLGSEAKIKCSQCQTYQVSVRVSWRFSSLWCTVKHQLTYWEGFLCALILGGFFSRWHKQYKLESVLSKWKLFDKHVPWHVSGNELAWQFFKILILNFLLARQLSVYRMWYIMTLV